MFLRNKKSIEITRKKVFLLTILIILFSAGILKPESASAQENGVPQTINGRITVFLDFFWHQQFIRENVNFVNYVRDKELSQVHIMMIRHPSGSAGDNYVISFIGRGPFEGKNNIITYWDPSTHTTDETRNGLVDMICIGLVPYLSSTGMVNQMKVTIKDGFLIDTIPITDPWKNWVFEIFGGASIDKEKKRSRFDSRWGFSADKISDDWKIRIRPYFNLNERTFVTDDGDIKSHTHRHGFQGNLIRSINQHWSVGLFVRMLSSTFHNIQFNVETSPGIEYSFFPYSESSRKSITVVYQIGAGYHNYIEETIFAKLEENLASHSLNISANFQQPWGLFRAGISGSHYFHDFKANRVELSSRLDLRIIKGLSLNLSGNFDFINDLVALPAGELSLEQILLQQSRQATSYQMSGTIGLAYTFGSKFSNVVNTRF
ncbi:MAG: hypothetical protein K0B05_01655 [Bacteroidales bacterium]|nr:hypothetical protein [Bacteroidales bacterium]